MSAQLERVNFAQMISGRYFVIPDYQRHYAWTERQCRELFDDCVLTARSQERERFMSTITTIAPVGNSIHKAYTDQGYAPLNPLLVVDGQQRLTSILILISCICRQLLQDDVHDNAARNAHANFVMTPLSDGQPLLRVIPQSIPSHPNLMRDFLRDILALDGDRGMIDATFHIPAQQRLRKAAEIFSKGIEEVAGLPEEERILPQDLLTCVIGRLIFIFNTLPDVGQAGEVFEGLNNRGIGLSALENLKAFSIYAVQSFRRGEALPAPMTTVASKLNDDFNDAIGDVYQRLDRVALPDDTARDLLSAFWPLVFTKVVQASLGKDVKSPPQSLSGSQPVDDIRASLHIQTARNDKQRAALLETLRFMICDKLVPASEFFADARRPNHRLSFEQLSLPPDEKMELIGLHQRLVEMQCSAPFLPIMIAHRAVRPNEPNDYLMLLRLVERVAFWVYELGERNKGTGQKDLARLARTLVDEEIDFQELLLALRAFAFSVGRNMSLDPDAEDYDALDKRVDTHLTGSKQSVWAAFAYEWLLSQSVKLPSYSRFLRRVQEDKCLRLVKRGRGKLPAGYKLDRDDMDHPGNIVITQTMAEMDINKRNDFNDLSYLEKRSQLKKIGYIVSLPQGELTTKWAENQKASIRRLAISRWSIPEDGRISEATWSSQIEQVFEDSAEEQDA